MKKTVVLIPYVIGALFLGTYTWAGWFPLEPDKHAQWCNCRVDLVKCEDIEVSKGEFWTGDGKYINEEKTETKCEYRDVENRSWKGPSYVPSLTTTNTLINLQ